MKLSILSTFTLFSVHAFDEDIHRRLLGGQELTHCMADAFGEPLGCTANDVSLTTATNIVVLDDGCQFAGDTVTFTADFNIEANAERYDIGLWLSVDGDPNDDGSQFGECIAATPGLDDDDGDVCGEMLKPNLLQMTNLEITTVCKANPDGLLSLPYCSSWRQKGGNEVCNSPSEAFPATKSKCKCDQLFFVNIAVPENDGCGGACGDPHLETWHGRKYEFQGICDLVLLHSEQFAGGLGLDIHIRTTEREGTSFIETAVVKIGNEKLEIHADKSIYWNDAPTDNENLPTVIGDSILYHEVVDSWLQTWTIESPRGGKIFVQIFDDMVDLKFAGFLNEDMENSVGLMGDFHSGFLLDRTGKWMTDTDAFGYEWQVRYEDKLFSSVREPQFPAVCNMPDPEDTAQVLANFGVTAEEALALCHDAGEYTAACVRDFQLTRNENTGKYYRFMDTLSKQHKQQVA